MPARFDDQQGISRYCGHDACKEIRCGSNDQLGLSLPAPNESMLLQLLAGIVTSIVCIAIHATVMTIIVRVAPNVAAKLAPRPTLMLTATMIATVVVLMLAHMLEVAVWAATYTVVGASPKEADVLYFAFVNYTTLGYGDVIPVRHWQLLGPATAMCGVLLFGWSTAVIFEVLRKALTFERPSKPGLKQDAP
jgi:hypothetical protein